MKRPGIGHKPVSRPKHNLNTCPENPVRSKNGCHSFIDTATPLIFLDKNIGVHPVMLLFRSCGSLGPVDFY